MFKSGAISQQCLTCTVQLRLASSNLRINWRERCSLLRPYSRLVLQQTTRNVLPVHWIQSQHLTNSQYSSLSRGLKDSRRRRTNGFSWPLFKMFLTQSDLYNVLLESLPLYVYIHFQVNNEESLRVICPSRDVTGAHDKDVIVVYCWSRVSG
jgi:hypothetical protein